MVFRINQKTGVNLLTLDGFQISVFIGLLSFGEQLLELMPRLLLILSELGFARAALLLVLLLVGKDFINLDVISGLLPLLARVLEDLDVAVQLLVQLEDPRLVPDPIAVVGRRPDRAQRPVEVVLEARERELVRLEVIQHSKRSPAVRAIVFGQPVLLGHARWLPLARLLNHL